MSGYCNWCDTLTNNIVKLHDHGKIIWSGCLGCYEKKKELENDRLKK